MASTERTPLTTSQPQHQQYVFMTNPSRLYRSRIKRFQCFVCAALLSIFVVALVITVSYSVNHETDVTNTTTTTTTTTATPSTTNSTIPETNVTVGPLERLLLLSWPLQTDPTTSVWPEPQPSVPEMEAAIEVGKAGLEARDVLEETTIPLETDTPSNRHQTSLGTGEEATKYARAGYIMDVATKELFNGDRAYNRSHAPIGRGPSIDADWLPESVCGNFPKFVDMCTKTPYRSIDGICNNPNHPKKWGVALRPFRRLLPPDYADGVSTPRMSSIGANLPSARAVSVLVHRPVYEDDPKFTVMLAVFGQFMDHDITATAISKGANMSTISCCYAIDTPELLHPECFPVRLDPEDAYYHQFNVTCMEFVRSAPAPVCSMGPREQMNQATSYLDGSVVYGATEEVMKSLRTFQGGLLKMEISPDNRELLPYDENPDDGCNQKAQALKNRYCFFTGDKRANENLHLTTMHLIFARQHNYLARKLTTLNPTWNDERLFQESRRIVAAQLQHITYKEFLPVLIGSRIMSHLNITLKHTGYHDVYNDSVDPTIANGFAASAFRFAHTLLPSLFRKTANDTTSSDYIELHKLLFDPFQLYNPGNLDDTLRSAYSTNTQKIDTYFTTEVTQKLFERALPGHTHAPGLDLVSLNIQRGRDHGLPAYPHWRRLCGLRVPRNFTDLEGIVDTDTINRLSTMFSSIDDVDMYSGALSEIPVEGGQLGPTVLCVLADQFYRIKVGDRFWYETSHQPQAFTPEQLQEIRKTSLASIICVNSDNIEVAQPWVMRLKKTGNYPVPCFGDVIQHPDLELWEEKNGEFVRPGLSRVKMGPLNSVRAIKGKHATV